MKTTYTRTLMHPVLTEATVEVEVFEEVSWKAEDYVAKATYTGVTAWDIIEGGEEAEEIEKDTDASGIDEYHNYLVLHFENGETATFRNSHVAMFIL